MKDVFLKQLENLWMWIQNNPFVTLFAVVVVVVAIYGINRVLTHEYY